MFNIGITAGRGVPPPVGEETLTGTGTWVCPPNVRSVSAVLVGQGGFGVQYPSTNRGSGGGGALTYGNGIPVVPGTAYSYEITSSKTAIFGMTAPAGSSGTTSGPGFGGTANTSPPATASFNGGRGVNPPNLNSPALGGSAGTYTSNGLAGGKRGVQLYGTGIDAGAQYGAGGDSVYSSGSTSPQSGAIRIIWGSGRSFPDNAA